MPPPATAEHRRLDEILNTGAKWRRWGTYLPERQWGTVREDYSADGNAWGYFPFDQAAHRAYRWGDDGLLGICDNRGLVCFATALWNGADPILKERLFGLSGPEGNHGEDVKELYWYIDATPTTSYARALYKYPQSAFPYDELRARARAADRTQPEPELLGTGVFDHDRYFDIEVEYAKDGVEDVFVRITATNRGDRPAPLVLLPQLWFRNTWAWASPDKAVSPPEIGERPVLELKPPLGRFTVIESRQSHLGSYMFYVDAPDDVLFTDNETNSELLWRAPNRSRYVKDAFEQYVVHGRRDAVNPEKRGTKCGAIYSLCLSPGESKIVHLRYTKSSEADPFLAVDRVFSQRRAEADEFYAAITPPNVKGEEALVARRALAGLLWSRQYYAYEVDRWLRGDPGQPQPPPERWEGRNAHWRHLYNSEVLSMPDKWEYPWYAAWDLAFHCVPLALVDPEFAKQQLMLLVREWYMHPNGQIPAYEWQLSDVNPPVHAWATLRVYQIERQTTGRADRSFLESVFLKLMLNFTWWVNRKDTSGHNIFEGGFLGLDNIGVFDRSRPLPGGGTLEQADATSWMGMYCLNMLEIALELAIESPSYQDVANKFFEHFLLIAYAMNHVGGGEVRLWDKTDGFFYDVMRRPSGESFPLRVRSLVGLTTLFAVATLEPDPENRFGPFWRRARWLLENRPELGEHCPLMSFAQGNRSLLCLLEPSQLLRILARMLAETEFLSAHGIRSLSKAYADQPFELVLDGVPYTVHYEPAESRTALFGGNSNWRGPVWFPMNYLIIESLRRLHHYHAETLKVECPTGSGKLMSLREVADELSRRLVALFTPGQDGRRPANGSGTGRYQEQHFRDLVTFHEYFHGDTGEGLGARAQTGWTALVAALIALPS